MKPYLHYFFIAIIALAPVLWFISILLLRNWNKIVIYAIANSLIYITYIYYFLVFNPNVVAFNVSAIPWVAFFVLTHVLIGFIVALVIRRKILRDEDATSM